jgi:hypothetical protein
MKITRLFLVLILFLQSSCVTQALWGDKSYEEKITQFFVGSDGRYVVLVGEKYHYIFADNSGVLKVILSSGRNNALTIKADQSYLKLTSGNEVKGDLVMGGPSTLLSAEDLQALERLGVRKNAKGDLLVYINLSGRRYAAKYLGDGLSSSNTMQVITIYYRDSNLVKNVGKVAVTPIAVGLDAVLLIGKVALLVLN